MQGLSNQEIRQAAQVRLKEIKELAGSLNKPLRFMEVCGTHTVAIFKAGLRSILPESVELVSGPGCPVCVTDTEYIDKALAYAKQEQVILATFGDMLKVPGTEGSLREAQAQGADVRIVYSPLDALVLAGANPDKKVIFLAVGFETTTPTAAATVVEAQKNACSNLYFLNAHKLVPPALKALLAKQQGKIDGFLLPGHVCAISGTRPFAFLRDRRVPAVVAGFEGLDLLESIFQLLRQVVTGEIQVYNEYKRIVKEQGNPVAQQLVAKVYEVCSANWRGLGAIPDSGLRLRQAYAAYDAERVFPLSLPVRRAVSACRCGDVLQGLIRPPECPLFGKACRPEHAVGACMVSVEGACAAWYHYGAGRWQQK